MLTLKGHFCELVAHYLEMKKYRPAATNCSKSFQKPNRRPWERWSRLVSANNYRRGNSSARQREEERVHGEQKRMKGEEGTIVVAATIGNFFGHRSSLRPTVIGRADGVAAGIRHADWSGTGVRKSLAAKFNACRTGWFIAMTLFSSVTFSRRYDDTSAKLCAFLRVGDFRNWQRHSVSRRTAAHGHHVKEICFLWVTGYNKSFLQI